MIRAKSTKRFATKATHAPNRNGADKDIDDDDFIDNNGDDEQFGCDEDEKNDALAGDLRESILGSLVNVGVLAALMMALAGAIYVDPPDPPGECFGESMLLAEMIICWMSMGFFFFSTIGSLVLYMDVDGVPSDMLLDHLSNGAAQVYCLPHIATAVGIFTTATAYGIDIGERGGCSVFVFGIIAAPCFVFSVYFLWFYCRRQRQRLFRKKMNDGIADSEVSDRKIGEAYLATWADRIPNSGESTQKIGF